MQYQTIPVAEAYESPTNPRGTDFAGKTFDELVASVTEKGVLVPVIARKNKKGPKAYEVIAGNRRLRAAVAAGLKEIPARIIEADDTEAREIQIIENLQREDVHPMEEANAYRELLEKCGGEVKTLALRVGKSETYVRGRLYLTNLIPTAEKLYRSGETTDGHAVLIAKLAPAEQVAAVKYLKEAWSETSVADLKRWIEKSFYKPLERQPWLGNTAALQAVGACKECVPAAGLNLFGQKHIEGGCTSLSCWTRKMQRYIAFRMKEDPSLVMVTKTYGKPDTAGALSESTYKALSTRKKDHCEFAVQGIVVEGPDTGTTIWLCHASECKTHKREVSAVRLSSKDREKRKKEIAAANAKEAREYAAFVATIKSKVSWPMSESNLDALLADVVQSHGVSSLLLVSRRLGFKMVKEKTGWGQSNSYKPPLREWLKKADKTEKLRMYFELRLGRNSAAFKLL